jgi:predicted Zn-ribbon and HTH transcriptional regulator
MGQTSNARCLNCGHEFELNQGGGFTFHLLRCDSCGMTKAVGFDAPPRCPKCHSTRIEEGETNILYD